MQFIPEHVPDEIVKEVIYEKRLLDLELNVDEFSGDRSEIDAFWSNILYAELDYIDQIRLQEKGVSILNYELHVSAYDSERMTVGVVIASFIRYKEEACFGPVAHTTASTDGYIIGDAPNAVSKRYSKHMIPHVGSLLAVAQQNFEPLEPRYA